MAEPTQRPRPVGKRAKASQRGVEATAGTDAAPTLTATQQAAQRGAPPPRVPAEVRAAQAARVATAAAPGDLALSDGEIHGLSVRSDVRRDADGGVTRLRCELRDGRLVDVSAGEGVLQFRVSR